MSKGHSVFYRLILQLLKALAGAEDQRDTPNACQCNDGIDDTAEQRGLSAADPSHNVKLEQTDTTPVQSAQDGKNQRNAIHNHSKTLTPFQAVSILKKHFCPRLVCAKVKKITNGKN